MPAVPTRGVLVVFAAALLAASDARAADFQLYDSALGSAPDAQGWLSYGAFPPGVYYASSNMGTTLDTTASNGISAGFNNYDALLAAPLNPAFPSLDRTAGFVVAIHLRITSEAHSNANRAGFSLLALAGDLKGIELGFWTDRVWTQSGPGFTHAEEALLDTTAAFRLYELLVLGGSYALYADGALLLSGPVRDYSSFGLPYDRPSLVFLGDNTSSANARSEFRLVTVSVPADQALGFHALTPCRLMDTRDLGAPVGGPALTAQTERTFLAAGHCGIPPGARAVSFNVTVTQAGAPGNLRLYPAGTPLPTVSTVNYRVGQTRGNNGLARLDAAGQLAAYAAQSPGTTLHVVMDVNGYFE
jgi:hypothetical protein